MDDGSEASAMSVDWNATVLDSASEVPPPPPSGIDQSSLCGSKLNLFELIELTALSICQIKRDTNA